MRCASAVRIIFREAADAKDERPILAHMDDFFIKIDEITAKNNEEGNGLRAGRRLWMFFSGHGFAQSLKSSGVLMANATFKRVFNFSAVLWADRLHEGGWFDEVLLFQDACRNRVVQLLRTYPDLRLNRDYGFANGGERSVARGYTKALERARRLVYVEDQYLWGHHVGSVFTEALRNQPDLQVVAVVPLYPDLDGWSRRPELLGRRRAMLEMLDVAPERVLFFGIENHEGTPVYVHAKTCIVDDTWATIGSDNFNRRSWTHDSELSAVVLDEQGVEGGFGQRLRLTLAAEHLDRTVDDDSLLDVMSDCVDPDGLVAAFAESAARLDAWHEGGQVGERPPGRLRRMRPPALGPVARALSLGPYLAMHDPDGRPRSLKRSGGF